MFVFAVVFNLGWSSRVVTNTARRTPPRTRSISACTTTFATTSVTVGGLEVPVCIWCPEPLFPQDAWQPAAAYNYVVDVGRIATKLKVGWLSWLPSRTRTLTRAIAPPSDSPVSASEPGDALIFAHGFLGSPFDMAHVCEALASDGFIVASPEMPESLAASYDAQDGVTREAIVRATQQAIDASITTPTSSARRWGIFGHSAGSGTALLQPGEFALGRICLATALGRCLESRTDDPLFLVASEGDGCNKRMMQNGAPSPEDALTLARVNGAPHFELFDCAEHAYGEQQMGRAPPRRGVLYFREGSALVPNHISFLWRGTNEAMFELLSLFLPLARALNLFLLDFDKEMEVRQAEPTAAKLVPAIRRFFGTFREADHST